MHTKYGDLMSALLDHRERCASEAEFRTYLLESARTLAGDLRDYGVEVTVRPEAVKTAMRRSDWNYLKIGCE